MFQGYQPPRLRRRVSSGAAVVRRRAGLVHGQARQDILEVGYGSNPLSLANTIRLMMAAAPRHAARIWRNSGESHLQ